MTALLAATIAIAQTDIKKVLAYSTVSQLGYMFLAVGVGGYWVAIFHMITHAFFKALLFLGAGSVMHGVDGEQDMRRMGALRKLMPITAGAFIVGWLAISGVVPLSGFWSKDEILTYALHRSPALYAIGLFTALLTAFYMSREVFLVFYGDARWNNPIEPSTIEAQSDADIVTPPVHASEIHPHESPWMMTAPLVVLAVLAALAGFINLPFSGTPHWLENWLEPVTGQFGVELNNSNAYIVGLLLISTIVAVSGIGLGYAVYQRHKIPANVFERRLFLNGWYYDLAVSDFMNRPGRVFFAGVAWVDGHVIDGAVNGVGSITRSAGGMIRKTQSGLVRSYAMAITIGAVLLLLFVLTRVTW